VRRLRRRQCVAALAAGFAVLAGCRREEKIKLEPTDESTTTLTSTAHAADPKSSVQLVKGFHGIEQNSWRWTMGRFTVTLRPPAGSAEKGATLSLKFSIPESVINKVKSTTLSVSVQGTPVGKKTYTSSGEATFATDVPASLLKGDAVVVEYAMDRFLPAGAVDARELGLVFLSTGFESK
jgi:hypothetical protein